MSGWSHPVMETTLNTHINKRIAAWRRHRGLSRERLAIEMELSGPNELKRIEEGTRAPTAHEVMRAMTALDATLEDLTDPFRLAPGEARFSWRVRSGESGE